MTTIWAPYGHDRYGDIHAADRNIAEQVLNTLLMLAGGLLWGDVIGTFCGVLATMNPQVVEFNQRVDSLNQYMSTIWARYEHESGGGV